jgi:hypothetical protein
MRKIFVLFCILSSPGIQAQNIQLHYDFGRQEDGIKRNYFVSTFELFKPDTIGYTFLFTDFEFNSPDKPRGVSLGYFEISREFTFPGLHNYLFLRNLGAHIEYNDGSVIYAVNDSTLAGENLRNSWLAGVEYGRSFNKLTLNIMFLYKYIRGSSSPDFQWTIVWFYPVFDYRVTLAGYVDIWTQQDFTNPPEDKICVLYSEPQIWYNFNRHLSIGSEFKISKNFIIGSERIEVFPTMGVKWEF